MKRQETASDIEHNALMEESVLLRIQQLQMGLLQLTDATTVVRLFKQFGKDIRYIAPWKKWIVWNGAHWEADSGCALIHTKGLEIVGEGTALRASMSVLEGSVVMKFQVC